MENGPILIGRTFGASIKCGIQQVQKHAKRRSTAMNRRAPMNAELRSCGAASRSPADDPANSGRNWTDGAPRLWFFAFVLLVLGGVVLWGIEKETEQIDFRLLVSALRATSPAILAAALAATALSYLAL